MRKLRTLAAVVVFSSVALALAVMTTSAAPGTTVVMSGLDNPRGLAIDRDGTLYVAEAGRGGSGPCRPVRESPNSCYGPSGAVSRLNEDGQERIVTGLDSYAPHPSGAGATGPHDVSLRGHRLYVTIGLGGPDAQAIRAFFDHDFGWLIRADEDGGSSERVADVAGYEFAANPDGGPLDSNPYGLLDGEGGRIVVDAGGNSLLRVKGNGNISTIAVFPSRAQGRVTDAVPNSVATGRDGAYYVGELTGAPFFAGIANVYRVKSGQAPRVFLDGFTAVIDLAFGCDGKSLYVLQHATLPGLMGPGALIRVTRPGTRNERRETIASAELSAPTSVAISCGEDGDDDHHRNAGGNDDDDDDDDGDDDDDDHNREVIYVSNKGTSAGIGEVLRIER